LATWIRVVASVSLVGLLAGMHLACALMPTSPPANAPSVARVIDATTGSRVTTGRISVDSEGGASQSVRLDSDGTFRYPVDVTAGDLYIDAPGYQRYGYRFNLRDRPWPAEFGLLPAPLTPYVGSVIDAETGAPITRGDVTWEANNSLVSTRINPDGIFRLDIPIAASVATGQLTVDAPGYERVASTMEIRRGQPTEEFRLVTLPPTPTLTRVPPTPTETSTPTPAPTPTPRPTPTETPADVE
jgi:hypothetical protein